MPASGRLAGMAGYFQTRRWRGATPGTAGTNSRLLCSVTIRGVAIFWAILGNARRQPWQPLAVAATGLLQLTHPQTPRVRSEPTEPVLLQRIRTGRWWLADFVFGTHTAHPDSRMS